MRQLDATVFKERGQALVKKIIEAVDDTQAFIYTDVPSELLLSESQYTELLDSDELQYIAEYLPFENRLDFAKQKLFYTGKYVLEVKVKEEA